MAMPGSAAPTNKKSNGTKPMFIAIRDLLFAKGRFLMMGTVVALVSFLVIILSGLSAGLVKANISGLMALPATHVAFEDTDHPSYRNTMVERYMWEAWQTADGVKAAEPMGHTTFNARTEDGRPVEIALWGLIPDSMIEPTVTRGEQLGARENGVIVSGDLLDDEVKIGDTITLDRVLTELVVVGIIEESRNLGHLPVIYAPLRKWQEATYGPPGGPPPGEELPDILFDFVSIIVLELEDGVDVAADYVHEPNAYQILATLLPRYVETCVYHAMLEASASEHGSRMTAMDSATNNASDMIDRLTLEMNRARQASRQLYL